MASLGVNEPEAASDYFPFLGPIIDLARKGPTYFNSQRLEFPSLVHILYILC